MKKEFFLYLGILVVEGVCFFMGMGFVLMMYRVFGPLVRYMWLIGFGWVVLFSVFSLVPLRGWLAKIRE
ncbi:MAG: hypothetical protein N2314_07895 [Brevinematales bacterium]|nr:hypothetical protein [Brevinematales bacterium]